MNKHQGLTRLQLSRRWRSSKLSKAAQSQAYQDQIAQQIAGITADTERMQAEYEADLAAQEAAQAAADAKAISHQPKRVSSQTTY